MAKYVLTGAIIFDGPHFTSKCSVIEAVQVMLGDYFDNNPEDAKEATITVHYETIKREKRV